MGGTLGVIKRAVNVTSASACFGTDWTYNFVIFSLLSSPLVFTTLDELSELGWYRRLSSF